ncbi:NirD/YgiW/YdeI family stress tolerance protein [Bordetella hinzii]|uniref:NirD/YgiW/YdeI family stress tolerance protein n=1 Tax=Bordetella hinzii TaxID=103855 RepID=UPI0039FDAE7F
MRLRLLLINAAAILLSLAGGQATAQYVGPAFDPNLTVRQMLSSAADDVYVVLRGRLVRRINDEKYLFDDGTGQVRVDIESHLFPHGTPINDQTQIEISGEFDREIIGTSEVEVKSLRVVEGGPAQSRPAAKAPAAPSR